MKHLILIIFAVLNVFHSTSQSINPDQSNEFCPGTEYVFSVTINGEYKSYSNNRMIITQPPYDFNTNKTSFKFKAKFVDINTKQSISFFKNDPNQTPDVFEFLKVKSLYHDFIPSMTCTYIQPTQISHNAPLCKENSFSINFAPIKWQNPFEIPALCFGSISDYEYLIPAGWKIDSKTSTGNAWIEGSNNANIITDLNTQGNIQIRPKNNCGPNLSKNQAHVTVLVNRQPGFTVLPAAVSIPCGSTDPVNFTINNTINAAGITDYTWDLGPVPNGWSHNGNPAGRYISSGLNNSIQLTPICGDIQKNVSANVTYNGTVCSSSTSIINSIQPSISISGASAFCVNSSPYILNNVPCSPSITWTSSNPSIASITAAGTQASLNKNSNGDVTLTATINNIACLTNKIYSQTVSVGIPAANNIILWSSSNTTPTGNVVGFVAGYPPNNRCQILSTEWQSSISTYIFSGNFPCEPDNETSKNIIFENPGTAYVQAKILNTCGWSDWSAGLPIEVTSGYFFYSIAPNPGQDQVLVKVNDDKKDKIKEVKIFDLTGNLKKHQKNNTNSSQLQLNTSDLKDGLYILEISGTNYVERQKISIKR
ncbi:MAG: T9SS type A sorting domain-containing protein [Chitinophagaceae bacterium]